MYVYLLIGTQVELLIVVVIALHGVDATGQ
jgi:hypothetical protein